MIGFTPIAQAPDGPDTHVFDLRALVVLGQGAGLRVYGMTGAEGAALELFSAGDEAPGIGWPRIGVRGCGSAMASPGGGLAVARAASLLFRARHCP